jgi:hypothetical protein
VCEAVVYEAQGGEPPGFILSQVRRVVETVVGRREFELGFSTAAFQDLLKRRRCSCDAPGFIELFYDTRRLLGLPIRG